ncbi:Peroxisomal membrane 22 kDa family protein [Perilla frutescens var. hirtella]|uniref:Peroxisomal membrane 22 kDa family protein n=1 Tax=Perilla frutescens var. hirtella TaxID=608512 RepID=A0AAD4PES6_PERFH|nr:Peroxisomal membrane 22 kDa family protein [Perilla frutescens var. hirtella]
MGSLGAAGNGGIWGMGPFHDNFRRRSNKKKDTNKRESKPSSSVDSAAGSGGGGYQFPLKQAVTSAALCLTGDTIAQLRHRWVRNKDTLSHSEDFKDTVGTLFSEYDYIRALRMSSYGFLLYGPGSYAWYQFLDHFMPQKNIQNLTTKVVLNQIVLGPTVIAVIFAWNNLWFQVLDSSQYIEFRGGSSSSPRCFHVHVIHILELLPVFNHEQMTSAAKHLCSCTNKWCFNHQNPRARTRDPWFLVEERFIGDHDHGLAR